MPKKEFKSKDFEIDFLPCALSAGIGVLGPYALKRFEPMLPASPLIPIIGPWGRWSSIIPIGVSIPCLAFGALKKSPISFILGITLLLSGLLNGVSGDIVNVKRQTQNRPVIVPPQQTQISKIDALTSKVHHDRLTHGRSELRVIKPISNRVIRA